MGFSLGGLISGAMKGVGEGMTTVAKGELENQQKLDYQKEILRLTEEKDLRVDQVRRDRDITDIGRKGTAEANTALATAPTRAQATVAGQVAEVNAAKAAGLPQLRAGLALDEVNANAPVVERKAEVENTAAAKGQVARTSVPGYVKSIELEDLAKSAGERSVAGINRQTQLDVAAAPKIQQDGNGQFFTISYDPKTKKTTTAALLGPDGQPLKGTKDLDARTKAMVEALLVQARTELDPDVRTGIINDVTTLLKGGTPSPGAGATPTASHIEALRRNPAKAAEFDAKFGEGASRKYLPATNTAKP